MATQTYLGEFYIDANSDSFALNDGVNTPSINIVADATGATGPYFMAGYTSESTDQLTESITTVMQAQTGFSAATCTFSYTTGKVTFTFAIDTTITWTDTGLRDILGFTASDIVTNNTTYTGSNEARYVWRPDRTFSQVPGDLGRILMPETMTKVYRSRDGTITSIKAPTLQSSYIEYRYLAKARAIIDKDNGEVNSEFESFFRRCIAEGAQVRLFPDDTATTSADYVTLVIAREGDEIGALPSYLRRSSRRSQQLWDVTIPVLEYV